MEKGWVSVEYDNVDCDDDRDHIHGDWKSLGCFLVTLLYHVTTEGIATQATMLREVIGEKFRLEKSIKYVSYPYSSSRLTN